MLMARHRTITIRRTTSHRTILSSPIGTILTTINKLTSRRRLKLKAKIAFLLLITINLQLIVGNPPVIRIIPTNHMIKSMVIMPHPNIKTQGLYSPVKASLLPTSLKNLKGKDKKTQRNLFSTISCPKRTLINSAMNLNLNNIIHNTMTLIKSIILALPLSSPQSGKEYPAKPILIVKTLKTNFHLSIPKRPHPKTNNIWLKLSQDPKSLPTINLSKISIHKFYQKILLNLKYPAKKFKVCHPKEAIITMMETKCLKKMKTDTTRFINLIQVLQNQPKILPKSEAII